MGRCKLTESVENTLRAPDASALGILVFIFSTSARSVGNEAETAGKDPYHRFWRGTPPQSKADYAFISHMVETALEDEGKVGVIVPHGVLFRGGRKALRKSLTVNLFPVPSFVPSGRLDGFGGKVALTAKTPIFTGESQCVQTALKC